MKLNKFFIVMIFMISAITAFSNNSNILKEKCKGLSNSLLQDAYLVNMDKNIILKTNGVILKTSDLDSAISGNEETIRKQLLKYQFYLLEQIATGKILAVISRQELEKLKIKTDSMSDNDIIKEYLSIATKTITVSDQELKRFYDENQSMMGGSPFESVKFQLKEYLINQRKQEKVYEIINNLGKKQKIEINQEWTLKQCRIEKDNIVDKTRFNGKPSMIDFGSKGCVPCDMMTPILENLKNKYKNKIDILFVHVNNEQVLGAKYGIQAIPVQVFFDKNGNEVFRHSGFFSEEEIEKKFKEYKFK